MKDLEIYVLPGMGDLSWCYSLLVDLKRPLIVNGVNYRGRTQRFGELLPLIKNIKDSDLDSNEIRKLSKANYEKYKAFSLEEWETVDGPIYFGLNICLEFGDPIEGIFPVLKCNYHYDIPICDKPGILNDKKPYIVFHTQSLNNIEKTGSWSTFNWAELARMIKFDFPEVRFVLIGENEDADAIRQLDRELKLNNISDNIVLLGHDFGEIIQIVNDANYVVAWASGIGILATVVNTPVSMFQFDWFEGLRYNWVPPEMVEDKSYLVFRSKDTPTQLYNAMKDANIGKFLKKQV